jgi:hypothetical protein
MRKPPDSSPLASMKSARAFFLVNGAPLARLDANITDGDKSKACGRSGHGLKAPGEKVESGFSQNRRDHYRIYSIGRSRLIARCCSPPWPWPKKRPECAPARKGSEPTP